jgi:lysophospholipase L1-like esterase
MQIDWSRGKTVIFIGSSVCKGCGATEERGWSAMAAERMARNGWRFSNCAIGGQTTADVLLRLERDVLARRPAVCFVGLGVANEGLPGAQDPAAPCAVFLSNLQKIVGALKEAGIFPIVGGVYPNDNYTREETQFLRRVRDAMDAWDVPVLQWLSHLEDGHGHFRAGWAADPGHPNDVGYAAFYEAIPASLWQLLDCPLP